MFKNLLKETEKVGAKDVKRELLAEGYTGTARLKIELADAKKAGNDKKVKELEAEIDKAMKSQKKFNESAKEAEGITSFKLRCPDCGKEADSFGDVGGKGETIQYCKDCKRQTSHKVIKEEEVFQPAGEDDGQMSAFDRADGLVTVSTKGTFQAYAKGLRDELVEDGFDDNDVRDYLIRLIDMELESTNSPEDYQSHDVEPGGMPNNEIGESVDEKKTDSEIADAHADKTDKKEAELKKRGFKRSKDTSGGEYAYIWTKEDSKEVWRVNYRFGAKGYSNIRKG